MKGNLIPLDKLPIGSRCIVEKLLAEGIIRRRMMDVGLINGTLILSREAIYIPLWLRLNKIGDCTKKL